MLILIANMIIREEYDNGWPSGKLLGFFYFSRVIILLASSIDIVIILTMVSQSRQEVKRPTLSRCLYAKGSGVDYVYALL